MQDIAMGLFCYKLLNPTNLHTPPTDPPTDTLPTNLLLQPTNFPQISLHGINLMQIIILNIGDNPIPN